MAGIRFKMAGASLAATQCQQICKSDDECHFFTWSETEKECHLLSEKSRYVPLPVGSTPYVSGPKQCPGDDFGNMGRQHSLI